MTTLKKIQQGITDLAIVVLILALGTVAVIAVSPWLIAARIRNRRTLNSRLKHTVE